MVRSMMYLTTLPLSFWDYALESGTRILNMVPTKMALMKRDTLNKLQQRSVKYIFIGDPNETMGYYFYFLPENRIVVARYTEFFKKNLITQEVSGRARELEEIQDEDTSRSKITSEVPIEVEGFEPPQKEDILIRRSESTRRAPNCLSLNIEIEEHSLGDLNKPTSYKAAMLDSESNKWIDAINEEIESMMDNMVWVLVDLPFGCKTVGNLWKRTGSQGSSAGNNLLDPWKIELRIERLKYNGVMELIADVQAMLKGGMQYFEFSHEVRSEAKKVQDLFFGIMKIAFADTDFREAKSALTFSGLVAYSSLRGLLPIG
ncbi:retrotransposon protein, putative, ty1-copia subclass [Tanacetum coccineum]|uniref:Retrotransposon protein, putative, ty1-copia subclass n=1 Tax=Tanacetum coccineum TaxID=301880 RepID=A0ABQ4YV96_9ASTR